MKKSLVVLLALTMVVVGSMGVFAYEQKYKVGVLIWNMSNPFYVNFIEGLKTGVKEYNFEVLMRDGQGDPNTEVAVVRQFITEKVDFIIVVPGDAQAIVPVLRQANEAGIPVIAANNNAGEGASIVTFVGADDYYFGQQQARLLVETIGTAGNVGYLMGELGTSAQVLRKAGFEDVLKGYPELKVVAEISEGWDSAKALAATQDILSRFPKGKIDAIVCQGPEAVAASKFAEQIGRNDLIWILGDYPRDVYEVIKSGTIHGTILQDPYPQAVEALHMARLYLEGREDEIPAPNYFLDLPLITQENVDQYNPVW